MLCIQNVNKVKVQSSKLKELIRQTVIINVMHWPISSTLMVYLVQSLMALFSIEYINYFCFNHNFDIPYALYGKSTTSTKKFQLPS